MATQLDFDNLVTRIEDATETFEEAITAIEGGVTAVIEQVGIATAQATQATDAAVSATHSRDEAADSATQAEQFKNELLDAVGYKDAPANNLTYGRNNNQWVPVEGGGSGGGGSVVTVNDKAPDAAGNVQLSYNDLDDLPALFSGDYNDLENKPEIIPEAPEDGEQYARQNGGWSKVEGGGALTPILNHNGFTYSKGMYELIRGANDPRQAFDGIHSYSAALAAIGGWDTTIDQPITTNPNELIDLRVIQYKKEGSLIAGGNLTDEFNPTTGFTYKVWMNIRPLLLNDAVNSVNNKEVKSSVPSGTYYCQWGLLTLAPTSTMMTDAGFTSAAHGKDFILEVKERGKSRELFVTFLNVAATDAKWVWQPNNGTEGKWVKY